MDNKKSPKIYLKTIKRRLYADKIFTQEIYKLYCSVLPENTKSEFIKTAEKLVESWEIMRNEMF